MDMTVSAALDTVSTFFSSFPAWVGSLTLWEAAGFVGAWVGLIIFSHVVDA